MDKLAELFTKLAETYGPNVVDAARGAAIIQAYSDIQSAIIGLIFVACCLYPIKRMWKSKIGFDDFMEISWPKIGAGLLVITASIVLIICIGILTDPWLYTAMSNPDLWIAKKVFKL